METTELYSYTEWLLYGLEWRLQRCTIIESGYCLDENGDYRDVQLYRVVIVWIEMETTEVCSSTEWS